MTNTRRVVSNACVMCPAGETNLEGDDATGPDTPCDGELCASNQRVMNNVCVACPAGTTNEAGDDALGPDTMCDATICAADERVSMNACVSCRAGTRNDPGDDASGADTMCDAIFCLENERVVTNMCVPCAPGSTNVAGDDASGDNGIEADNNGDNNDAAPRSFPTLSNLTIIGSPSSDASDYGMLLREGTAASISNATFGCLPTSWAQRVGRPCVAC